MLGPSTSMSPRRTAEPSELSTSSPSCQVGCGMSREGRGWLFLSLDHPGKAPSPYYPRSIR